MIAADKSHATPDQALFAAAQSAARRAYAPYSNFHVGCALRTASGAVYVGCNVENEAYPATICAERAALAAAVVAEGPTPVITDILVYAENAERSHTACTPCGTCRQVMAETAPDARVGFFTAEGHFIDVAMRELLPYAFREQIR